ncbi:hypothetical protein F5Y10DRAFT_270180 [Nemania abortiva]|nr:hypothetical protein F5Y10DRAFT_270180 [Nemania abortiva]
MGQTVSNIKNNLQNTLEKERQANDALNSLQELAGLTSASFYQQILSTRMDSALIPINKIVDNVSFVRCGVSEEAAPIAKEVEEMFSDFASGKVGQGLSKVLSSGLKLIFGQYSANSAESTKYTIACGELGGVYRLDIHMYSYQYTSEQLTSITKNVVAMTVVLSSVDTKQLDDNTLRIIVQKCYAACDRTEQEEIYNQIKGNIKISASPPPLHAIRHSFQLGAARANGLLPSLTTKLPAPDNTPGIVTENFSALVLLTFGIGAALQSASAIKAYVTGALARTFHNGLEVSTSPQEDDPADQFLVLSVFAVRYLVSSDVRRPYHGPDDTPLLQKLDECLDELKNADMPAIGLRAYRFLLGAENDTPGESSLFKLVWPELSRCTMKASAILGKSAMNGNSTEVDGGMILAGMKQALPIEG